MTRWIILFAAMGIFLSRPALSQEEGASLCVHALQAQHAQQFQAAVDGFTACIESDNLDGLQAAIAHYHRATAWRALGDADRATDDYDQTIALQPNLALAYNGRGVLRASLGNIEGAREDLLRAIGIDAGFVEAYQNLGYVYWKEGMIDEAIRANDNALLLSPDDPQRYLSAALPRLDARRDLEGALALADTGLALDPALGPLHDLRGHVLALLGRPDESLVAFQTAMDIAGAQLVGTYETSLARQGFYSGTPDGEPDGKFLDALRACIAQACDLWAE